MTVTQVRHCSPAFRETNHSRNVIKSKANPTDLCFCAWIVDGRGHHSEACHDSVSNVHIIRRQNCCRFLQRSQTTGTVPSSDSLAVPFVEFVKQPGAVATRVLEQQLVFQLLELASQQTQPKPQPKPQSQSQPQSKSKSQPKS